MTDDDQHRIEALGHQINKLLNGDEGSQEIGWVLIEFNASDPDLGRKCIYSCITREGLIRLLNKQIRDLKVPPAE